MSGKVDGPMLAESASSESTDSKSNSEDSGEKTKDKNKTVQTPDVYCWRAFNWSDDYDLPEENVLIQNGSSDSLARLVLNSQTVEVSQDWYLPPDTWLLGGTLSSKTGILVFKSSALANPTDASIKDKPGYKLRVTYKVLQAETKLLSKLLDCHGISEVAPNASDFNLLWTGSHPKPGTFRSMASHQRVNHFPRSYELTRKDRLYKNIEKMQHSKGLKNFDFIPQTFVMPMEFRELCSAHHRVKGPWIVKPVASSRGRGIFIVETPSQVPLEEPVVVAKYISKPMLVSGHKCDLRLYIVVTSFDPLLIYIYEEGLVRFATVKYDSSHKQLWNPCMHLCNYSINKYHSDYVKSDDPSAENVGHKWTLSALLRHLKSEGRDTTLLMSQIEDLVIKAVLCSGNSIISACKMFVPNPNNCFELFGFDILIDENLKPWLLEVNLSPSLNCDSPLDVRLKSAMLADLLTLIGIPAVNPMVKAGAHACRRVLSADGLSGNKKSSLSSSCKSTSNGLSYSSDEQRVIRNAKAQFERRGGFVRIFPAIDTWAKYSQYLDPTTGVPVSCTNNSTYNLNFNHNYNLLLYKYFFPDVALPLKVNEKPHRLKYIPEKTREPPIDNSKNAKASAGRQDRYERMLSQGHKASLQPSKANKEGHSLELRKKVVDLLKQGKKISQCEARKTFSQYLVCILRRIVEDPEQSDHVDIVLKFLQRASNYLRTPFNVKTPSQRLEAKDRSAIIAKQLNDFLYLYNRETEMFVDKTERPSHVPSDLYSEFLLVARECDLEEVLIYQTAQNNVPSYGVGKTMQGILKCIPNSRPNQGNKVNKSKSLNVSPLS